MRDDLLPALRSRLRPLCVRLGQVSDRLLLADAILERRIVQIGDAALEGVVEPTFDMRPGESIVEMP